MIFVSHKETDASLASALVDFIRSALNLPPGGIRCTSVPGFQLPFGRTISGQLKEDIGASNAVFVLLTQASLQSRWVLFELGAAWALGKAVVPILGPGLRQTDLPGPLAEYPVVRSDDVNVAGRLRDAVAQVASELAVAEKGGGEPQSRLESFVQLLRGWAPSESPEIARALAFQLSWLLSVLLMKQARHPAAVQAQVEAHSAELHLTLPTAWRQIELTSGSGQAFMDLVTELGGQLVARRPELVPYFEAGFNLLVSASKSDELGLAAICARLDLPKELRKPSGHTLEWVNRVHDYFEGALQKRAG